MPRRSAARRPALRRSSARREGPRSPVEIAPPGAGVQPGGTGRPGTHRQPGRRRDPPGRARPSHGIPPPEARPPSLGPARRAGRVRRRDRSLSRPQGRRQAPGRSASGALGSCVRAAPALARCPGGGARTGRRRSRRVLPGAVERPDAARAARVPAPSDHRAGNGGAAGPRSHRCRRNTSGPGGPPRRPGPSHLSRETTSVPLRARRRAKHRSHLCEAARPRTLPDLRRGPVLLVGRDRASVRAGAPARPRPPR